MWLSIKLKKAGQEREVIFFPSPMVFPITIGKEFSDTIIADIPQIRLEYAPKYEEIFLVASSAVFRIQDMVKNEVSAGKKIFLRHQDVLELEDISIEISLDKTRGDFLAKNEKAKDFLEKKFGKMWLVGYGGIASVYAPENSQIAIKILGKGHSDPKIIRRFVEASEKIHNLDHLGLVKMGKTFSHPDINLYYCEMEYCRGITLAEWIARKGKIAGRKHIFQLLKDLAEVIGYISSHQIVHRDIHPRNILVEENLAMKLIGFTLIKSMESDLTQKGTRMFTPNFTSPEQIADPSTVGTKADIFSLGALAYYLLAETLPFGASNHSAYIKLLQKKTKPIPLQEIKPDLPAECYSLISRSLSFNRLERPETGELILTLRHILQNFQENAHEEQTRKVAMEAYWDKMSEMSEMRQLGRFQIIREIGHGGLGRVYEAKDTKVDRSVALKLLRRGIFADEKELRRFQEEARLVSRLRHEGVARIYEIGREDGHPYIVMELIEGIPLDSWGEGKTPREIAEKIREVAEILEYAHSENIIHRDIKPSNIMVITRNDRPVLLDFGMAREIDQQSSFTKTGEFMGTPAYASPEHFNKMAPAPSMDVYSLGIVFYELLTGKLPYDEEPLRLITMMAKGNLNPVPPSSINRHIACDLETICLTAMHTNIQSRYTSAGDLAEDIERFLQGETIKANPPSHMQKIWHWSKRHWQYLVPTALALILIIIALIYIPPLFLGQRKKIMLDNLEKGKELIKNFPGQYPRETMRSARLYVESARAYDPDNKKIQNTLQKLHQKYCEWAIDEGRLELAQDSLASLKILAGENSYQKLESQLAHEMELQKQRDILVNWEMTIETRLQAAKFLANDTGKATLKVFEIAQNDPQDQVRSAIQKILFERQLAEKSQNTSYSKNNDNNNWDFKPIVRQKFSLSALFPEFSFPHTILMLALLEDPANKQEKQKIVDDYYLWLDRQGKKHMETLSQISKILYNKNSRLRILAIRFCVLSKEKSRSVIPDIISLLDDPDKKVRIAGYQALLVLGNYEPKILIQSLSHPKPRIAKTSALILSKLGSPALSAIIDACGHSDTLIQKRAYIILKKAGINSIPLLIDNLAYPRPIVQEQIITIIKSYRMKALPFLLKAIENSPAIAQENIIDIISELGPKAKKAETVLLKLVETAPRSSTRFKSLRALTEIMPISKLLPVITRKLEDNFPPTRMLALSHLKKAGQKAAAAVPIILKNFEILKPESQILALETLAAIGPKAEKAKEFLTNLFADSSGERSYAIAYALSRIGKNPCRILDQTYPGLKNKDHKKRLSALFDFQRQCLNQSNLFFLAGLRDENPAVAQATLVILAKVKPDKKILDAVVVCLDHPYPSLRRQTLLNLGQYGKIVAPHKDKIITMFQDNDEKVRIAAALNIFKITGPSSNIVIPLLRSLNINEEQNNQKIMKMLLQINDYPSDTVEKLILLLQDSSFVTLRHTIALLGHLGPQAKKAIPNLILLYSTKNDRLQRLLDQSLQKIGLPSSTQFPALEKCLFHQSPRVREKTLVLAERMGEKAARLWYPIIDLFKGAGPQQVKEIRRILDKIAKADKEDLKNLLNGLKESNYYVRLYSVKGLVSLKNPTASEPLLKVVLYEHHQEIREQAIKALIDAGAKAAPPLVKALIEEKKKKMGQRLSLALAKMGKNALPPLLDVLKNTPDNEVFSKIATVLIKMERPAVVPLLELLQSKDNRTRQRAIIILTSLIKNTRNNNVKQYAVSKAKETYRYLLPKDKKTADLLKSYLEKIKVW